MELEKPRLQNRTPWLTELGALPALARTCCQFPLPYLSLPGSLLRPQDGTFAKSTLEKEREAVRKCTLLCFPWVLTAHWASQSKHLLSILLWRKRSQVTRKPSVVVERIQSPWKLILERLIYSLMTLFQSDNKSKLPWDKGSKPQQPHLPAPLSKESIPTRLCEL